MSEQLKTSSAREKRLNRLEEDRVWDVVVIGGGAMGAGLAVDAASRGFSTLLLEAQDFSAGTSGHSSNMIRGGVRYMKDPRQWKLVQEAVIERKLLLLNAPHIVRPEAFILPCYENFERALFLTGLGLYSAIAGAGHCIGRPQLLSDAETIRRIPGVRPQGLKGGVQFWDAIFNDARLNIALVKTAESQGATAINYLPVEGFGRAPDGGIETVKVRDLLGGKEFSVKTRMVFNATGGWVDKVRRLVNPNISPFIRISRGSHIIVSPDRFNGGKAMFIPKINDGRGLFFIPWQGVLEIGCSEVAEQEVSYQSFPSEEEIQYLLETAGRYLEYPLQSKDVMASFSGFRAGINPSFAGSAPTLSGDCAIIAEFRNMITVAGGKWTTYRRAAEAAMAVAVDQGLIYKRPCSTKYMSIYRDMDLEEYESLERSVLNGTMSDEILTTFAQRCIDEFYALSVDDVLFRRLRIGQISEKRTEELRQKLAPLFS